MDVGRRVREVREDLGMQRTVLARRVGVAENTIYRIETGKRAPSVELLEKIAHELRTEPADLFRDPYSWLRSETTEDLRRMALEEAQYAKAPTVEEALEEHKADKKASNEKAHRRTLAYANINAINAVLYERGVRSPVELAIKQYNEAMGADSVPEEAADEASEAG
jgi:transcriptional regulator with XRE-family HTH domain